jgi:GNAT superfamily N-acetyltransferase
MLKDFFKETMKYTLNLTDVALDTVRESILVPLRTYNDSKAGPSGGRPLVVTLCDAEGTIIGGLWGSTGYGWLYTQLLAVPDSLRGQRVGSQLLAMAEAEAIARGCHSSWLDTFEFQARGFYEKLGYTCFGELPDYPVGFKRIFLQKKLLATS